MGIALLRGKISRYKNLAQTSSITLQSTENLLKSTVLSIKSTFETCKIACYSLSLFKY